MNWSDRLPSAAGVSLLEMLTTAAIVATVSVIMAPAAVGIVDNTRLGMAARDVERELQFARLKAVAANTTMRIRFDCPVVGQLRVVELIGTQQAPDGVKDPDTFSDRCDEAIFPFRPAGADRLARPNNDGPIRYLQPNTTLTAQKTLEFWPNGTVHADAAVGSPWPLVGAATITVTRKTRSKNITVNSFGKIQMDR